jgi:hypothetical protein
VTLDFTDQGLVGILALLGGAAALLTARAYFQTRYRSMLWLSAGFVLTTAGSALEHLLLNALHWDHHDPLLLAVHGLTAAGFVAVLASALQARQVPGPAPEALP